MASGGKSSEHGAHGALFSGENSKAYAVFRPDYPSHIYQLILDYAQLPRRSLAVDVGSGSGQATRALAQHFDRVIAIDASTDQLSGGDLPANVETKEGTAEETGVPDQAADLVTAAAALHWFNRPAFYREVRRILKPSGALAAWTYSPTQVRWVPHNDKAERAHAKLIRDDYGPFFPEQSQRLQREGYRGLEPSREDFAESERVTSEMEVELSVAQLVGIAQSWSAFLPYLKHHGEEATQRRLQQYKEDLMAALAVPEEHTPTKQVWTVDLVLARKPVPVHGA